MESNTRQFLNHRRLAFALVLPFAFCLLPFALRAQQQDQKARVEAGRRIFSGSCSMGYCHGLNGAGGGGPKLAGRRFSVNYLTKVINDGVPETTMPGFKNNLNKDQLANLIAYMQTLATATSTSESAESPVAQEHFPTAGRKTDAKPTVVAAARPITITKEDRELMGDAAAGRELFFGTNETTNCRVCHTVAGIGGKVGPDLTSLTAKPAKEILQSITTPHAAVDGKYAGLTVALKDGSRFTGVKRDEDATTIRLYDTSSLPPVSRAFLKSEVARTEMLKTSPMPADYGAKYSRKQLLDLVAFLKTAGASEPAK
ncbi:MAG: c-type cytochrome [Acidobacteriota bacterium]|nr:c-type cytochrome [Acidobacteriota bacterium]